MSHLTFFLGLRNKLSALPALLAFLMVSQLSAQTVNTATVTRPAGLVLTCVSGPAGVGLSYASNAPASCSATDTDSITPVITIASPVTVAEGTATQNTVSLSNASAVPVTVTLTTAGNGANPTVAADLGAQTYSTDGGTTFNPVPASGIITIPAGVTSVIVRTATIDDIIGEPAETFAVTLSAPANAVLGAAATQTVTNTISASDPVTVSITNGTTVPEGTNSVFTISLSNPSSVATSVTFNTSNGTAVAPGDYTAQANVTVTIPAGSTSATVNVVTLADAIAGEGNETINGTISAVTGGNGATIATATAIGTISDATGTPTITITSPAVVVEGANADNLITLSTASATPVTVTLTTAGNGANPTVAADLGAQTYSTDGGTTFNPVPASGIITIPAGVTSVIVRTATIDDIIGEPAETFAVTLSAPANAVLGAAATQTVTNTISASDPVTVSITNGTTVPEGTNSVFTISLSNPSSVATSVTFNTSNGTAVAPGDYTAQANVTVTIPAGSTSATVNVVTLADAIAGEGNETINGTISAVTGGNGATIATATAIGTISDATGTPTITITSPAVVVEGANADNLITLSTASATPVTVTLTTAGNGANPTVAADLGAQTYSTDGGTTFNPVPASGIITIPAGVTSVIVRTATINDIIGEPAETFAVTLSAPANAVLGAAATQTVTNTISASDPVTVSITNGTTVPEGTNSVFTISLSNPSSVATSVTFNTSNGTAVAPGDYTAQANVTVTIPAGSTSATVNVVTLADAIAGEGNETINGTISAVTGGNGATIATATAIGTISDATGTPTITITSPAVVVEGANADNLITLSTASATPVTVTLTTAGNGANPTVAADLGAQTYSTDGGTTFNPVPASGIITIPAGVTSVIVRTATIDDIIGEPAETFAVTLSAPANAVLGAAATQTVTNTISASDPVTVSITNGTTVPEGTNSVFTISLSNPSSVATSVTFNTSNGTAVAPGDYTAQANVTVTIPAGSTSATVNVVTLADAIAGEGNETINGTISAVTGGNGATIATATAIGTISDATGTPTITITSPAVVVEGANADNLITLSTASATPVTVTLTTAGNGANPTVAADLGAQTYSTDGGTTFNPVPASGIITIPAGVTSVIVRTATINDIIGEPAETFAVTLSAPANAVLGAAATQTVTNTISASDPVTVSITNGTTVPEGTNSVFTISLSNPSSVATSVTFNTSNGTAVAPGDYTAQANVTVTIPAGSTSATVNVVTLADAIAGEGNETINGTISAVTGGNGATIATATAIGTISDATGTPTITITSPAVVVEGANADNLITLSTASATPVTVTLTTAGNGANPTVAADLGAQTYSTDGGTTFNPVPASGIITIPAGVTSVIVRTATIDDIIGEPAETFAVTLSAPANAVLGAAATQTVTNTISASDPVTVSITNGTTVPEGTNSVFTISLSNPSSVATSVTFNTSNGTAVAPGDYTAQANVTVTIPAGSTSATVNVVTLADAIAGEGNETINGTISAVTGGNGATIATATAIGTISDATGTPTITITSPAVVVEGANADNLITLSTASATPVTVTLTTAGNGANPTVAADLGAQTYSTDGGTTFNPVPASGIITIPAGVTSVIVRTATIDDIIGEPAETFAVTLSAPANAVLGAAATQTVTNTISASDPVTVSITNGTTVPEGTNSVFTISLSNPSSVATSVTFNTSNGTAVAPGDYTAQANVTVTIPAGSTSATVNVVTLADAIAGEGNETINGTISAVTGGNGATIATATAIGTISDATGTPTITITSPAVVVEGANADNLITLSTASATPVTVTLTTAGNGANPTVAADLGAQTYSTDGGTTFNPVPASGIITIPAGVTSVIVRTATINDIIGEPAETFAVTLSAPANAVLGAAATQTVTNTISASDPVTVSITNGTTVPEGTNSVFTISLSNPSSVATSVTFNTSNGTAVAPGDYTAQANVTVTIPAGSTSATVNVVTLADAIAGEGNETINGTISAVTGGNGATIATATAIGTISDATGTPTITITSPAVVVEGANADNLITLSTASATPVTVTLTTAGNGANPTVAADLGAQTYSTDGGTTFNPVPASGIITIPAGVTSVIVRTATIDDIIGEPAETFAVTLSAPANAVLGAAATQTVTNTISASDPVTVSITNGTTVPEGTNSVFTISLSNPSSVATSVTFNTSNGTAVAPGDYTAQANVTVTIPAGSTSATVNVVTLADAIAGEGNETINGTISAVTGGNGATIATATAIGTISDATGTPTITITSPAVVVEGANADNLITLSTASATPVTVTLTTAGNGANPTVAADLGAQTYSTDGGTTFNPVPASGIITIPAGVTSVIVRTATINDIIGEPAETFAVTLSAPANAVLGAAATQTVTNTISASDPVTVSITNGTTVPEGTNSVFTISLSNPSSVATSVTFNTSNGTAVAPGDYTAQANVTVTIPAGSTSATVNVVTLADAIAGEGNETINGTISAVTGGNGATIATATAIGTISDATGTPTITITSPAVVVEGANADNLITLSTASATPVTVTLTTAGNGANPTVAADLGAQTYSTDGGTTFNPVPASGIITIPAGVTSVIVRTATIDDIIGEPAETFAVTLSAPANAVLGAAATQTVTNTISASDPVTVSITNGTTVPEGTNSVFTISLSNPSSVATSVTFNTSNGTAVAPGDYTAQANVTVTIPAGSTSATVNVVTLADAIAGEGNETINGTISAVTGGNGATIATATAIGTISDATGTPTITITSPAVVVEGANADNLITLSTASATPVTVTLTTAGNGANPTVAADLGAQTYSTDGGTTFNPVPASGIITIPAGVTSVIVRTATIDDIIGEPAETFAVTLSAPANAVLGAAATQTVTNTISASDPVTVSITNGTTVPEGTNSVFTISLSNPSSVATSVTFNTSNGTAVAPGDYTAQANVTVTIPAGSTSATVNVVTLADAIAGEGNETINGTISAVTGGNGATIATATAIGTISDATGTPTITITSPAVVVEGANADNLITLSTASATPVTVTLTTAGNGANPTVAADLGAQTYSTDGGTTFNPVPASGIITIPAGVTSVIVRTATIDDIIGEPAETFAVTLSAPANAVLGAAATQTVTNTISASDPVTVSITNGTTVPEGTNSVFTISLSNPSSVATSVTFNTSNGTAVAPGDYTAQANVTVTIPAGSTSATVNVVTLADAIAGEGNETINGTISAVTGGNGATIATATAIGTISDATGTPTITITSPAVVVEGANADNLITLSTASATPVTVTLTTAGNGANPTVAADLGAQTYSTDGGTTFNPVPASGIITIPAGVTSVIVRTATIDDIIGEPAETFAVTLSAPANAVLGAAATQTVTNTISASDPVTVSITNGTTVPEGTNSVFTISLSNPSSVATSVTFNTSNGTAVAPGDYTAQANVTVTIPAGSTSATVNVVTLADAIAGEGNETINGTISAVTGGNGATIATATAIGTISDATGTPTITITSPAVVVEGANADNLITLSTASATPVTVTLTTAGNGANPTVAADLGAQTYSTDGGTTFNPVPASGIITIPAGVTSVIVRTATINDIIGEPAETFAVTLSAPANAVLGAAATQTVTNTISASDPVTVSITNGTTVPEGTNSVFTISLSNPSSVATSVTFNTSNGTAVAPGDYTAQANVTVTIPAGSTSATVNVVTLADAIAGEGNETINGTISAVTGGNGATIATATAIGTISDATGTPTITITSPAVVVEGANADNLITLSTASATPVTVTLTTAGNGANPTVAADLGAQTYSTDGGTTFNPVPASGIITIPAGVTSVIVRTATIDDIIGEPAETFAVTLSAPANAVLGAAATQTVTNTISASDPVTVSITNGTTVPEGTNSVFTISLSNPSSVATSVTFNTSNGTAVAPGDYTAQANVTVTIPAGSTSATVNVVTLADAIAGEGNETINGTISAVTGGNGATIATATAIGTISDATGTPTITITSPAVVVEGANADNLITLSTASATPVTVTLTTAGNGANPTVAADLGAQTYSTDGGTTFNPVPASGIITIPAGVTSVIVRTATIDDIIGEPAETFAVTLSAPANAVLGAAATQTVTNTISASDPVTVSITNGTTVPEGTNSVFTISLSNPSSVATSVTFNTSNGTAVAPGDYTAQANVTVTIPAGSTSATVNVVTLADAIAGEGNETINGTISAVTGGNGATIATATAIGTISDATGTPTITITSPAVVVEGANADNLITLSTASATPVTVTLTTAGNGANPTVAADLGAQTYSTDGGTTFNPVPASGIITIPAGVTSVIVRTATIDDIIGEPAETFAVTLSAPANAVLGAAATQTVTNTISASDPVTVSITNGTTVPEGTNSVFTISLSNPSSVATSVTFNTSNGTAVAPGDYTAQANVTVTIPAGSTSATVNVVTLADAIAGEGNETINGTISAVTGGNGATIATATAIGTISDATGTPTITITSPAVVVEGANADNLITLSTASATPVTVTLTTAGNGANPTVAADLGAQTYSTDGGTTFNPVPASGIITIPAGVTSVIVRTATIDDIIGEPAETFAVTLSAPANAVLGAAATQTVTNTISASDPVTVSITNGTTVPEGTNSVFTISLSNPSSVATSVTFNTSNGTAVAPGDYTAQANVTVTIPAGSTSATVNVVTLADAIAGEGNETINGTISAVTGGNGATIATATAIGTISDATGTPTITITSPAVVVEGANADNLITLSTASATPVTVTLTTAGNGANPTVAADLGAQTYSTDGGTTFNPVPASGIITIPAGVTSVIVRTATINDIIGEPAETFAVTLSAPANAVLGAAATQTVTNTISASDPVTVSITNGTTVPEGTNSVFTISLSNPSSVATSVTFNTSNGTAVAPGDYTAQANVTVTIPAGSTSATVNVVTLADAIAGEGNETINGTISAVTGGNGATIATATAIGTISDATGTPTITITSPAVVVEGANADNLITLSTASATPVTVTLTTAGNGANPTVAADLGAQTYSTDGGTTFNPVPASGIITIPAGVTSVIVRTATIDDIIGEPAETFAVTLSAPANAVLGAAATQTVTNTISASDPVTVSITNGTTVPEGTNSVFTISLSNPSSVATSVTFNTSNGTAVAPGDYTAQANVTVTIPAGSTSATVNVVTLADAIAGEGNETINGTISAVTGGNGATIATATAIGTISDATGTPTITITSPAVVVEGANADNLITLSTASATPVTVTLTTAGNGANPTVAADLGAQTYSTDGGTTFNPVPASGIITIPAGVTSVIVRTATIDDIIGEPAETFAVTLSAPANAVLGAAATQTVTNTISASDPVTVSITNGTTVPEGTNSVFTISLSNPSSVATSVTFNTSNGTAVAPGDYTAQANVTVTIPAGSTSATVNVVTLADAIAGEGNETINGTISAVTGGNGATIATATAIGTISDATGTPTITITSPAVVVEGANADNLITLSTASATPVTVTLTTAGNGANPTVAADLGAQTYSTDGGTTFNPVPASGIITIPAGVTSVIVRTATIDDIIGEPAETFAVTLSAPANAVLGAAATQTVTNTISASDPVTVSITNGTTVPEGTNSVFTISLSNPSSVATSVTFNTSNGTAVAPGDYTAQANVTVTIPAGSTSATVNVVTLADAIAGEGNETINGTISAVTGGNGATIATATAIGTISDATGTPTITITSPAVVVEGANADNLITLSTASATPVTVTLTTAGNGANPTVAADLGAQTYSTDGGTTFNPVPASGIITIPAGVTSVIVRTATILDLVSEPNEKFAIKLIAPNGAVLGALGTEEVVNTILADIFLTVTKTASQTPLVVGKVGQFYTISIAVANGPTTAAITVADTLPAGITTSGAITATGGAISGCPAAGAANLVGCSIASGAASGTIAITVPVSVAATTGGAAPGTPVANTATVTGGGDPSCPAGANCTSTVTTPVIDAVDDTTTKQPGVPATTDVSTNDKFPSGSTFSLIPGGTCAAATMTPAGVASYTSPATAAATCTVNYQVCAPAPNTAVCDTAVLTVTASAAPILTVTKTASQTPLVVGKVGQFYTISIAVANGPTTAAITVADTLPAGITTSGAITATGGAISGCPAAGAANLVGCSIASGAASGTIAITVPVSVAATTGGAAPGTPVANTATVTGGGDPSCPAGANCTSTVTTPVIDAVDDTTTKQPGVPATTDVSTNDKFPSGSTFSIEPGSTCTAATVSVVGVASYTSPASSSSCTVIYKVCAPSPNDTVCDVATLTVNTLPSITGSVYNDSNGTTDALINGTASNLGSPTLTAYLVDTSVKVVSSSPVAINGAYSLDNVPNGTYSIILSNTPSIPVGQTAPSPSLPSTHVTTAEGQGATSDGTPNGVIANVVVNNASLAALNFAAEQPPTATSATAPSIANPTGTTNVSVPPATFVRTDPEDGPNTPIRVTTFPTNVSSVTLNGVTYTPPGTTVTATTQPFPATGGVTVPATNVANIAVDPVDGSVNIAITYVAVDAAGKESAPAVATLPIDPAIPAAITGIVWRDSNRNNVRDPSETLLPGVGVTVINSTGAIVGTTTTDANGVYTFNNLPSGNGYSIKFNYGTNDLGLVAPLNTDPALNGTVLNQTTISNINLTPGVVTNQQNARIVDPQGIVYDSMTRAPIAGATVSIIGPDGLPVPAAMLLPATPNNQVVGPTGSYTFLLAPTAPTGAYSILVAPPSGYNSTTAVLGGVALPAAALLVPAYTPTATTYFVQPQSTPPIIGVNGTPGTTYHTRFLNLGPNSQSVINNHVPLDPAFPPKLLVSKAADRQSAEIGDTIRYTITVQRTDNGTAVLPQAQVIDSLPAGFRYIDGSARITNSANPAGIALADPIGSTTPVLRFNTGSIPAGGTISFSYRVRVGAGALQGTGINRAQATAIPGAACNAVSQLCSNEAQSKVSISAGVFTAQACVTGKVFADCNNNHVQDPEELGIPGVRLYMQDGTSFTTDIDGKYSFCGITPNTNVLVIDQSTLPSGAAMTTTSSRNGGDGNSLFLDLKNGDMQNASFAEGSCSNNVIEQIKARRARGAVNSTPTSAIKPAETLKFIGKPSNLINQSTDSANQGSRAYGNGYQAPVGSGSTNPNAK